MYRNQEGQGPEQQDLEVKLSRLEQSVGLVFERICERYQRNEKRSEDNQMKVHLSRKEMDDLRRFLFIMLYRNRTLESRFKDSVDDYTSNDRNVLLKYMNKRGFTRPKDVWFSNMHAFLDIDLAREPSDWYQDLHAHAYPQDALWFYKNMEWSFISVCTAKESEDEFLMTQNAYSIYEGPAIGDTWADYHMFAPVSPMIMIVSRSILLSTETKVEDERKIIFTGILKERYPSFQNTDSFLLDLPIKRPSNNYSSIVNRQVVPHPTKMGYDKHRFDLSFFPLSTSQVQRINMIFLEQAIGTEAIIYKSHTAFKRALEFYLADRTDGFKIVPRVSAEIPGSFLRNLFEDRRKPYLELLERFAREEFGSSQTAECSIREISAQDVEKAVKLSLAIILKALLIMVSARATTESWQ